MLKAIRKMFFLFILILIIFLILLGVFGEKGYFVNRELEKLNAANEEVLARLDVKKESLIQYEDSLTSTAALDDIALKLGYNKSGEEVYFFSNESSEITDTTAVIIDSERAQETISFKGLSVQILVLISSAVVIIPYLFIKVLQFFIRRGNNKDNFDNRRGGYEDYSF